MEISSPEQRQAQFERTVASYDKRIAVAANPVERERLIHKRDEYIAVGDRFAVKMEQLKKAYDAIKNSEDPLISNAFHEEIADLMEEMVNKVGDTPLRDMTQDQLDTVYNFYKVVAKSVKNANETFAQGKQLRIDHLAHSVIQEVKLERGWNPKNELLKAAGRFGWRNLKPVYAFETIGSETLSGIFNSIRKGEDTWAVDMTDARSVYLANAKKYGAWSWDMDSKASFTSASSKKFELTLGQMMSVYAYSKRQAARDHLKIGGVVMEDDATAYNISDVTLAEIINTLTDDQKSFVDGMLPPFSLAMMLAEVICQ